MIDQRGSLRSQPLQGKDTCTLRDLVEDTEALRVSLGIRRWSVLGHSFGGYSALLGLTFQPELFKVGVAGAPPADGPCYAMCKGKLVALGDMDKGQLHPNRVFRL